MNLPDYRNCTVAILGLGYVGLPLLKEIAACRVCNRTKDSMNNMLIGFDINTERISELKRGIDRTKEVSLHEIKDANVLFTSDVNALSSADVFIVTVPTPIDSLKRPDLNPLQSASKCVANAIKNRLLNIGKSSINRQSLLLFMKVLYTRHDRRIVYLH